MTSMRSKCKMNGCANPVINGGNKPKGLCSKHFFEQYGKEKGECKVDGCARFQYAKGYCTAHYQRLRKGCALADISKPIEERKKHNGERCSVGGCERLAQKRTLCGLHYRRKLRGIDLHKRIWHRGRSAMPEGLANYKTVHERLRRDRGPAAVYACVDCGRAASDWSYQYGAPDERRDEDSGYLFSEDQSYYVPRCRSCNLAFDHAIRTKAILRKAA